MCTTFFRCLPLALPIGVGVYLVLICVLYVVYERPVGLAVVLLCVCVLTVNFLLVKAQVLLAFCLYLTINWQQPKHLYSNLNY
jgi:hypothetical protein